MSFWKYTIIGVDWRTLKLAEREALFLKVVAEHDLSLHEPQYAIVWEDPTETEEMDDVFGVMAPPAKVTTPSPLWITMAMHGGILPPVEVYWALAEDEAQPGFTRHSRGHLLHDTLPLPALTEEQAMEYLVQMVIPPHVWRDYKGNRTIMRIVPRDTIPSNRQFRDAWRVAQYGEENGIAA